LYSRTGCYFEVGETVLEQTNKKVLLVGGVIRLANNCKIENGKVLDVNIPKTWLGRSQALEYIRAFVLGRMAWSRASGLILISGAFGAFDRKIVLECGGYDRNTVGEDMELVVRMRKYMEDKKIPYKVQNIQTLYAGPKCQKQKILKTTQQMDARNYGNPLET
jgi:cellulose synthase/poly-beta-1,6-N-acetylglucosamine synthase-like glycosyltransferase